MARMVGRHIYVTLAPEEHQLLLALAAEQHRRPQDQAAYLISQALERWEADKRITDVLQEDVA